MRSHFLLYIIDREPYFITATESQALESDYFYFINGIRAKEKTGPFTDVTTFDRNDGVIVDQSITQIQQGLFLIFSHFVSLIKH